LFKQDSGGSRNGKIVLVESDNYYDSDFGSRYSVKQYHSEKGVNEDGVWGHEKIVLRPLSTDSNYEDIVLTDDELINFRIRGIFDRVLTPLQ
jgi:hypothetical protein